MAHTKQITITLTEEEQQKGRELATKTLGRANLSGWISFIINQESNSKTITF